MLLVAFIVGLTSACARVETSRPAVEVEMQNVDLHITPDIALHVHHLRGHFVSHGRGGVPYLDDKQSYIVEVDSGQVAIDLASLNAVMTRAMGQGRSNVEHLQISIDKEGALRQKGVIDKAVDVPFNVKASVEATPDGRIRIVSQGVKGFGVPIKPVMKLFHVEMDDLLRVDAGHGVTVENNDLLIDPSVLLPPPAMRGRITAVRTEGNALIQTFGTGSQRHLSPPAESRNYIYWRGGQLSFGKLTMTETDLELVDNDPKDAFDFSVDRWNDQLVAGYSKTTTRRGLKAHVPDYNDLPQARHAARR